jgi:hypothetical protein
MIKSEWIVSSMAERNALTVASADVYQGAECMVLSTGSVFRAVRSGTGATMWAGVCTESGEWTPTFAPIGAIKADPAMSSYFATYTRIGDLVRCVTTFEGQLDSATAARSFSIGNLPVNPGSNLGTAHPVVGALAVFNCPLSVTGAGTDAIQAPLYATEGAKSVTCFFSSNEADATAFDGTAWWEYFVAES